MNNPVSLDPRYALYPLPVGCAGNRLYEMLREVLPSATMGGYARRFERINLVSGPWDAAAARVRAAELRPTLVGRHVVLLGLQVARAFEVDPRCTTCNEDDDAIFYLLPHPSGRNLLYNDPGRRRATGELLARLYETE
jgi:hypothetical protein